MTIDKAQLRALAEAATQGTWIHLRYGVIQAGPEIQFINGAGRHQIAMATGADWMVEGEQIANAEFMAAANPSTILTLLAEIESLDEGRKTAIGKGFDCWAAALAEIDKLRAELAGLRTGYDAQNQVIASLKAENEELEKAAMSYAEDLQWHTYELDRIKNENGKLRYALKRIVKSTDGVFPVDHRIGVHFSTIELAKRTLWPGEKSE